MSDTAGETPNTKEAGETPAKPDTPVDEKPVNTDAAHGETPAESEDAKAAAAYKSALDKERQRAKELEKQLSQKNRTTEDRVADLERQNQELRLERMTASTLDKAIADVGEGYTVSRAEVMELLDDAKLTEANIETIVTKFVAKLKKPATTKTPDNSAPPADAAGKADPTPRNPWAGANF